MSPRPYLLLMTIGLLLSCYPRPIYAQPGMPYPRTQIMNRQLVTEGFQDILYFTLTFTAPPTLTKPIRALKGMLYFTDLFDEPKVKVSWTITDPMFLGATVTETVGFTYNQFMDNHQWANRMPLRDMHCYFMPQSVLYADGTRQDLY